MAGFPQLREVGVAHTVDDPGRPLAWVRLFERKDGSGRWEVWLNWPAEAPRQVVEHPDDKSAWAGTKRLYASEEAREELAGMYDLDAALIRWRVRQPDGY